MNFNYFSAFLFLSLIPSSIFSQEISVAELKKHITYLSSDDLEGRGTSSEGEKKSAEYIQQQFRKAHLLPKGTQGYFHEFTFKKNPDPHDTTTVSLPERKGINVAGFLDNRAEHTVVIGAHHDHLGLGHDKNSLDANSAGKIHNGADDNASGVAGLIELANYFSNNNRKENFNFLFICFSGEELGLFGSKKFCENPTIDFSKVNYMVNLDMIGRLSDSAKKLVIYGVGTAPDFVPLIDTIQTDMYVKKDSAGIGPSDQTSFYLKNIPVLHFFTGQHSDYHKPSDDVEKINFNGQKQVIEFIIRVIEETEKLPKLAFTPTKNSEEVKTTFKVTLGIMPDYTFEGKGVRADGVTDGKPAGKAGMKAGDVIIQLGENSVSSMQDYMKALSFFSKGDSTKVKVLRESKDLVMDVIF